jgi:hypothetical protein
MCDYRDKPRNPSLTRAPLVAYYHCPFIGNYSHDYTATPRAQDHGFLYKTIDFAIPFSKLGFGIDMIITVTCPYNAFIETHSPPPHFTAHFLRLGAKSVNGN